MHDVDVAVLGGGPVGLYAAYYAGYRGLSVAVIDALGEIGGQVTSLYPEKEIHDVAGFRAIRGADLVQALAEQAAQFQPLFLLGRQAIAIGDIHLEDLAGHLVRQGMTLIADHVESEAQVVDLLDYDVHFAQGFLFSAPRQVRPEVLAAGGQTGGVGRSEAVSGR